MIVFRGYFKRSTELSIVPAQSAGATFGPWADHETRCKCNVCR
jgi:hypothetical protein